MLQSEIMYYLDSVLNFKEIRDDYTDNGLQVEGKKNIFKIAFSVDATSITIQKAIDNSCDMLICHHGIFWPSINSITGVQKKRLKLLLENDINLVGMHIPLDINPEFGNNVGLIDILGGNLGSRVGKFSYLANFNKVQSVEQVKEILDSSIGSNCKYFDFSGEVKKFAVCSGGGAGDLYSLLDKDVDLFITGELRYDIYDYAREHKISLIEAGHYATETVGIKNLMNKMKKELNLETIFIDSVIDI